MLQAGELTAAKIERKQSQIKERKPIPHEVKHCGENKPRPYFAFSEPR